MSAKEAMTITTRITMEIGGEETVMEMATANNAAATRLGGGLEAMAPVATPKNKGKEA